jgi:gamma-glutamyltranspeptidase/glutathione hydrolase
MAAGGDAVDAAVAVSFALGVLEPWMSGPAGGGAMVIWRADSQQAHAVNFGMRSSAALDVARYPLSNAGIANDLFPWEAVVDDRNVRGATSVAVPGTVAGIAEAHAKFGTMPWHELLSPAIEAAKAGVHVDWYAALIIASSARELAQDPDAAALFLEDGRWPKSAGWTALADIRLDQSRMADSLEQLAHAGPGDFYTGDLARSLVADVSGKGGFLTQDDLSGYRTVWSDPLEIPFRGAKVFAVPGLTAGPTLADTLTRWSDDYTPDAHESPQAFVSRAKGLREAYQHRLATMGDHDAPQAPGCTTHFSIVDAAGNMVSMTQTLLSIFGSKVVSPSTGFLLNNGIMWFDPVPGRPNSLAADKACLMNVCPVIGQEGSRQFALGASGGRKIMPAVAQILARLVEQQASMQDAIEAPRLDVSGGDTVIADDRLPDHILTALAQNFPTRPAKRLPFPFAFACPAGVLREGTMNSGTTETLSPWGDAVAQSVPSEGPV